MKINHSQYRVTTNNLYKDQVMRKPEKEMNIEKQENIKVEISDSAKVLAEKVQQSGDTQYSEKVEAIRKAVLEGSYKVSPEKIADKMLVAIDRQKDSDGQ